MEQLRLELGLNIHIFQTQIEEVEHLLLTQSWIRHAWSFCSQHDIILNINPPKIQLACINDVVLMEAFQSQTFSPNQLHRLNKIRMFLKAFTLADISTGDGRRITSTAWAGKRFKTDGRCHGCRWPNWEGYTSADTKLWTYALKITFCKEKDLQLDRPLLDWYHQPPDTWQWFIHNESQNLFCYFEGTWSKFKKMEHRVTR